MDILSMALGTADIMGDTFTNYYTNKANIKLQKDLAYDEFSRNYWMWNQQNEYNSPLNQMLRLKEAGLNPNLMYGKGTTGNSEQLPKYNRPDAQVIQRPPYNMLGGYVASKSLGIKEDAVQAEIANKNIRTLNEALKSDLIKNQSDLKAIEKSFKEQVLKCTGRY